MTTREDDTAGSAEQIFDVYEVDDDSYEVGMILTAAGGVVLAAVLGATVIGALQAGNVPLAAVLLVVAVLVLAGVATRLVDEPV